MTPEEKADLDTEFELYGFDIVVPHRVTIIEACQAIGWSSRPAWFSYRGACRLVLFVERETNYGARPMERCLANRTRREYELGLY